MSYIVEQKINGRIYLYKVDSYWDKTKKQARQKRTYIGPKNKKNKSKIKQKYSSIIHKNYGNIFLVENIAKRIGVKHILQTVFPNAYNDILALAYYDIMEGSPLYLFPYWHDEQYLINNRKLHSSAISNICEELGLSQVQRLDFICKWIEHLKPINGVYYDITSISSYSSNIDFIEWGYNRDKENLAQLNYGVTFCQKNLLPIYYNVYPGSIVDVKTLKNCIEYLKVYNLSDILFILDRGFFSKANVLKMDENINKVHFIQPLPFTLTKVKSLLRINKYKLKNSSNSFKFNDQILHYKLSTLEFDDKTFDAHIFYDEKSEVDQKHSFLNILFELEEKLKLSKKKILTLKEYLKYRESNIPKKYCMFFKWNKKKQCIEKNIKTIKVHISKMGSFILLTNNKDLDKIKVLEYYRQRDRVEKVFDIVKNEFDTDRIRAHSQYNTDGRLFIKFISLIIYMEISRVMKEKELFKRYSVKELLSELKKLKITKIEEGSLLVSELSKSQRKIFEAFGIKEDEIEHSY